MSSRPSGIPALLTEALQLRLSLSSLAALFWLFDNPGPHTCVTLCTAVQRKAHSRQVMIMTDPLIEKGWVKRTNGLSGGLKRVGCYHYEITPQGRAWVRGHPSA